VASTTVHDAYSIRRFAPRSRSQDSDSIHTTLARVGRLFAGWLMKVPALRRIHQALTEPARPYDAVLNNCEPLVSHIETGTAVCDPLLGLTPTRGSTGVPPACTDQRWFASTTPPKPPTKPRPVPAPSASPSP